MSGRVGGLPGQSRQPDPIDSVASRFIAGNAPPDHETIAAFRQRFLGHIADLFVEVLKLAHALGMLKLNTAY
jgi:hypothetical protein